MWSAESAARGLGNPPVTGIEPGAWVPGRWVPAVGPEKDLTDMDHVVWVGHLALTVGRENWVWGHLKMMLRPAHMHGQVPVTVLSLDMAVVCKVTVEL